MHFTEEKNSKYLNKEQKNRGHIQSEFKTLYYTACFSKSILKSLYQKNKNNYSAINLDIFCFFIVERLISKSQL